MYYVVTNTHILFFPHGVSPGGYITESWLIEWEQKLYVPVSSLDPKNLPLLPIYQPSGEGGGGLEEGRVASRKEPVPLRGDGAALLSPSPDGAGLATEERMGLS